MVFSSNLFLFGFLPAFLACLFIVPAGFRNAFILAASLAFYAAGSGQLVWILVFSIVWNYYFAHLIGRKQSRHVLMLGVLANLSLLGYFKYANFFTREISASLAGLGLVPDQTILSITLPIGISFYTFQATSYLIDVYRRTVRPSASLVGFGMYLANFPQLIAGPIVRYSDIEKRIEHRPIALAGFSDGIFRFCMGLGKKILIADAMGEVADLIFALPANELTTALAWLGVTAYTLQIYFDFSGYSDMAIGLGKMMGFTFPENFNQPYRAKSITEFWRRWHMTLSSWFRDYLYIPLGGNRKGPLRTYFNLFAVFFLCGLWHGAAYTFIAWGLFHGVLLTIERLLLERMGIRLQGMAGLVLTIFLVMISWVVFRTDNIAASGTYLLAMAGLGAGEETFFGLGYYLTNDRLFILCIGWLIALAPFEKFDATRHLLLNPAAFAAAKRVFSLAVLLLVTIELAGKAFNPFIYFRF
jgi:alginate O-acetyltransferase complex protein AlgI